MIKNTASQKWIVFAFNRTSNAPVTGDAANITANLRLDGGAANPVDDTNPAELSDGYYAFDLTAAETNADLIVIIPASATADVLVIGVPGAVWTESDFTATMKTSLNAATPASVQNIPADGSGFTTLATAAILKEVNQSLNGAVCKVDRDSNTFEVYDTDGVTLLFTITKTTAGNIDTLTRT